MPAPRTTRAPGKRAYHHGELPRALMDAALRSVAAVGPDALSLREAARVAGVTHAAAYRHFQDKATLLAALALEGYRLLAARLERAEADAGDDATARLQAIGRAYVRFVVEERAHFKVMFGSRLDEDQRFPALFEAAMHAFGMLTGAIARGIARGELRDGDPQGLALTLWSLAHGYADLLVRGRIRVRGELAEGFFLELLTPVLASMKAR